MLLKIRSPTLCSESRGLIAIIMFEIQYTPTFLESLAPIGTRRSDAVHNPQSGSATKQASSDDQHFFLGYASILSDGTCIVKFLFKVSSGADFGYDHQFPTIVF